MTSEEEILRALSGVRDPELDEPLTDLGFVGAIKVDGDAVRVRLRLPAYFCAPNFAYLMVADARTAILSLPGVRRASVTLDDHFASDEIDAAVNQEQGFGDAFPGEAVGELDELRKQFRRKAFVARQERLARSLLDAGYTSGELAAMRIGDLPDSEEAKGYLDRRIELGLEISLEAPLVVDPDGRRVPEEAVVKHLRFARTVRTSIETNGGMCRSLLASRYGLSEPEEKGNDDRRKRAG